MPTVDLATILTAAALTATAAPYLQAHLMGGRRQHTRRNVNSRLCRVHLDARHPAHRFRAPQADAC